MPRTSGRSGSGIAAFFSLCIPPARWLRLVAATAVLAFSEAQAQPVSACEPEGALPLSITDINLDGTLLSSDNLRLKLAGIVWPDALQPRGREQLLGTLRSALAGQRLAWKPAAVPDRWGITPAHLFVAEPGAARPFWLQAGLAERGFVPVWPEALTRECLATLEMHERTAIAARRGHWAPRAQAQRHSLAEANREANLGRRMAGLFRVHSSRAWRGLYFVNFTGEAWPAPSVSLTQAMVADLAKQGVFPRDWRGRRLLVRFVYGPGGLRRLRAETIDHIRKLD